MEMRSCHLTDDMDTPNPYQAPKHSSPATAPRAGVKEILFTFNGRIPRRTYWLWSIVSMVVVWIALFIVGMLFGTPPEASAAAAVAGEPPAPNPVVMLAMVILYIPLLWISVALGVKRWHDRGKSGWWFLIGFVPLIGEVSPESLE